MEDAAQGNFRSDMTFLIKMLIERLTAISGSPVQLNSGEVVINHYNNLKNEAIVIEGFVDKNEVNIHIPFKALLDLQDTDRSLLFVPSAQAPTDEELKTLKGLNDRIVQLGGDPMVSHEEPSKYDQP